MRYIIISAVAAAVMAQAAFADTVMLVLGNTNYQSLRDVDAAADVVRNVERLRLPDTTLIAEQDANARIMRARVRALETELESADRLVIVLSGAFAQSANETYFLTRDSEAETLIGLSSGQALPMSVVMSYLATKPGQAFLVLASPERPLRALNDLATTGIGELDIPQGVTVLQGSPAEVAQFVRTGMPEPGAPLSDATELDISGYNPAGHSIFPEPVAAVDAAPSGDHTVRRRDILDWRRALDEDSIQGYQRYLLVHPDGAFAEQANRALNALREAATPTPEQIESALDLNRDQRRDIQRDLSLLEYDTRGIDGIFGGGTRAAIRAWQTAKGETATGFLTAEQIQDLDRQAALRAEELEAEARERRRQLLEEDRNYWAQTGARGRESGYRAYLEEYPDGEFSDIARRRLDDLEAERRAETSAQDRRAWDLAVRQDTIEGYRVYLDRSTDGAFETDARARIRELREDASRAEENRSAARAEEAMNLNLVTRRVVEQRLARAGFNPGVQDGVFDENTRRAIRRYQASRNLPQTGYLNDTVVVRLLADSVRSIFE